MFLRRYRLADLRHDVVAGILVALVAITLSIPFAIASGAGSNAPAVGLVTVVVGGTAAALFGGSRILVTGPTGGFIVVLASVVQRHGFDGLLLATLMAGAMLVVAGLLRFGQIVKYIPYPVTVGFTAGLAIAIFAGQLPDLLGVVGVHATNPVDRAIEVIARVAEAAWAPWSLAIAAATVSVVFLAGRFLKRIPNLVIGLVVMTGLVVLLHAPVPLAADRFSFSHAFPAPRMPAFSWSLAKDLLPDAATIAFLGALQSLLAAIVADGMTRTRHDSNQELIGQGLANVATALVGGIAVAGAVARTATGIQNGARTPVTALVHAVVVLLALLFLSPLIGLVPIPVMAGLLAVVCWNMSQRHHLRRILKMPRADAAIMLATLVTTVAFNLGVAVLVGMVLSVGQLLARLSAMTHVDAIDPSKTPQPTARFEEGDVPPGVVVYSIDGPFFFGAADQFQEAIARVGGQPKVVILRMRSVPYLDATGLNVLVLAIEALQKRGTRVMVSAIQAQPLELMETAEVLHVLGDTNLFRDTPSALVAARLHLGLAAEPSAV